ncbi:MAG: flap endonuclease-1 [Candidatus Methanomethylicota archaeon]|jgi:flap endonuclease-1|uniref:Flap endonuclease 1 n=1 Tax=Thermoproteota archaeon TaxID=2056631 RepID=A0A520KEV8_9CREN|nr:MAG: flap endonuclease-1 [Candidatus Verstraetearchaeota archaeon]TDA38158.1 MAG: flap endonuclease-1 [Candidatus Verstraetearchaeota archaeon]
MGVNLKELVVSSPISLNDLKGKVLAIDAYNALYQFLATIRQPDGTPLLDLKGRITSHLSGLFYRTVNFLELEMKPVYIFDGKPPELKLKEIEKRMELKEKAEEEYKIALEKGDIEAARKAAQATSRLTSDMVADAKELLDAMGVPWIQAPSEGEAQAAFITKKGDAWATVSQDYDSLLFGAPRLVRNLTISGRRKLPNKPVYIEIEPEIIFLDKVLSELGITREQLIDIAILLGTDYNPDGFKGIGPKKAIKIIKGYKSLKSAIENGVIVSNIDIDSIREIFLNPKVTEDYKLTWKNFDEDKIKKILCDEHNFSLERVTSALERLKKKKSEKTLSLDRWFK